MPSVIIIGANRGIGLGFAKLFSKYDNWNIYATTRNVQATGELGNISDNISIYKLDVVKPVDVSNLAKEFENKNIDLIIHNAGVYGHNMTRAEVMEVNSLAPFKVIDSLMPSLLRGDQKKIAILTSQMGARNGGKTPTGVYGASKAALNDQYRIVELEWRKRGISSLVFHPGWVKTDMGGSSAPVEIKESVIGMYSVLEELCLENSGRFMDWRGMELSW